MKNEKSVIRILIGVLVIMLFWNGFLTYKMYQVENTGKNSQDGKTVEKVVTEFDTDVTKVVEQVSDKVVTVVNVQSGKPAGSGSGVLYKNDGKKALIVTNHHVVDGGQDFIIQLNTGDKLEAKLIGSDPYSDLALLEVNEKIEIEPIKLGDSSITKVGEFVVAIGSPLDLEFANSVTFGVISGKDRKVPVDLNGDKNPDWEMVVTQTDAAINPGNSGGALVNMNAELVGINSMKIASSGVEGIAFSIPVNEMVSIVSQIEEFGKVQYPIVGISGISIQDMNPYIRSYYEIPKSIQTGVFIAELPGNSPAKQAGAKEGDVITKINDKDVINYREFRTELYKHKSGETITIEVNRNGEKIQLEVKLG